MHSILKVTLLLAIGFSSGAMAQTAVQKEVINPDNAPAAIGPYSQGIKFGDTLYVSGQIPIDPKTKEVMANASIEDQTRLVIENIRAVLTANGMTLDDVVATQVFLKDMNEFPKMNAVYAEFFKSKPPARATVEVVRLPRDVRIEIAATARR